MNIGEQIKQLRLARGWSVYRLAKELKMFYSTVHAWDTGKRKPQNASLKKIQKILGPVDKV